MATIELVDEQIGAIVVQELKYALESTLDPENMYNFCLDFRTAQNFVDSLKTTLGHFMFPNEYDAYMREINLMELVLETHIEGHYSELENFNRKPDGA